MEIKKREFLAAGLGIGAGLVGAGLAGGPVQAQPSPGSRRGGGDEEGGGRAGQPINTGRQTSAVNRNYKPRRLNKAIELWEDGQPVYYTGWGVGPGVDPYEQGKKMCKTYADVISIEMEHGLYDLKDLREFMRGLADGGGTASGHRMPSTFVTPPVIGLNRDYVIANSWVLQQIWDAGVMGVHICHARDPQAIEVAAHMCSRYPFAVPKTKLEGLRGASASFACEVWGMNNGEYVRAADLWPLNPKGELMLGIKIEDTHADANAEISLATPGIAFAEWGPTDNNYWVNGFAGQPIDGSRHDRDRDPKLLAIRAKVLALCKKNKVQFLNSSSATPGSPTYVVDQIKDGARIMGASEDIAFIGREFTKRTMPI
jgi:4-hydroxy-2-oxoheptanedioate aldolase